MKAGKKGADAMQSIKDSSMSSLDKFGATTRGAFNKNNSLAAPMMPTFNPQLANTYSAM